MAHLGTGGPAPVEWVEVVLMDRFKWTLPETRAVPLADGMRLLTMLKAEAKVAKSKNGRR